MNFTYLRKWRKWCKEVIKYRNLMKIRNSNSADWRIYNNQTNDIKINYNENSYDNSNNNRHDRNCEIESTKNNRLPYHDNIFLLSKSVSHLHSLSRAISRWRRFATGARVYYSERDFLRGEEVDFTVDDNNKNNNNNNNNDHIYNDNNNDNNNDHIYNNNNNDNDSNNGSTNDFQFSRAERTKQVHFISTSISTSISNSRTSRSPSPHKSPSLQTSLICPDQRSAMVRSRHISSCRILTKVDRIRLGDIGPANGERQVTENEKYGYMLCYVLLFLLLYSSVLLYSDRDINAVQALTYLFCMILSSIFFIILSSVHYVILNRILYLVAIVAILS